MIVPVVSAEMAATVVRMPLLVLIVACVLLLVGLWLSFVGWLSKARATP
ncbi:MAG: hypothetical protein ABI356_09495 [Steroidobacteraceae bacterium]